MKKLLIALFACSLAVASCSPLRIVYNSTAANGDRTVFTSSQSLFGYGKGRMDIALGSKVSVKDTLLAVLITSNQDSDHGIFDKGDRLLIRLKDDSVITLVNMYDKEYDTEINEGVTHEPVMAYGYDYVYSPWADGVFITPYEVTAMVPRRYITKTTNSYALYLISKADILNIINKGVKKLRVEDENEEFDMENPEYAAEIIGKEFDCLVEGILAGKNRSEF